MVLKRLSPKPHSSYKSLALVTASWWVAIGCGGEAISIGGDPVTSDDTRPSTTGTTRDPNDSTTHTGGTSGGQTSGGGNTSNDPAGVHCADYAACDALSPCESGDCVAFPECETALCIPVDEACRQSCPADADCAVLESYPVQIACEGRVPAIPGSADSACTGAGGRCLPEGQSAPPTYTQSDLECSGAGEQCWVLVSTEPSEPLHGVSCANRQVCDVDTRCPEGQACLAFPEIGLALCIETQLACHLSCPYEPSCVILDSYPGQIACPNRIDARCEGGGVSGDAGVGDAGAPVGVTCDDHTTCDALSPCDGGSCIKVPGCDEPLCIDAEVACEQTCGEVDCRIAESYPAQLFCATDRDPVDDPDQPVSSNDASAL